MLIVGVVFGIHATVEKPPAAAAAVPVATFSLWVCPGSVSYTHLDVYKRQDLLVPELSESYARGEKLHLRYIIERVFHTSFLFIVFVMATFFFFADELGQVIYAQVDISYYLRMFAPLILLMYADIVIDGILKGLGQQFSCMVINVVDSGVSVLLILLLVPRYGVMGYVMVIMIGEGLNFALSLARLFLSLIHI